MKKIMTAALMAIMVCSLPMTAMAATKSTCGAGNKVLAGLKNNSSCSNVLSGVYSGNSLKSLCDKLNVCLDGNCDMDSIFNGNCTK